MEKFLTRMSSFPLSSRVQYVLGPLPSTRVCVQVILFSVSHVTRLCGQLQSNGSLLKMHFFIYIYSRPTLEKKKKLFPGKNIQITLDEFFCPFAFEL